MKKHKQPSSASASFSSGSTTAAIQPLLQVGAMLKQQNRYQEAAAVYYQLVRDYPENGRVWYGHGEILAILGDYRAALTSFDQAIALLPNCVHCWTFRAVMLLHLEQYQAALESCDRALRLVPNDPEAWTFRGVALTRLGRYRLAYASYARATGTPPTTWWTLWRRRVVNLSQVVRRQLRRLWR